MVKCQNHAFAWLSFGMREATVGRLIEDFFKVIYFTIKKHCFSVVHKNIYTSIIIVRIVLISLV